MADISQRLTPSKLLTIVIVVGAVGLGYFWWRRRKGALGDARLDREMARKSLREELEAIDAYTRRLQKAEDPRLKQALHHARKEEREHAAAFRQLTGPDMLKLIAKESRSPEEFARRAEAWASTEATPPSITKMVAAYRRGKPAATAKLIRAARKKRLAQTDTRWKRLIAEPDEEEYVEIF